MAKRKAVDALDVAAQTKAGEESPDDYVTSAYRFPRELYNLFRAVSLRRAQEQGGRPSVSAILIELVEVAWFIAEALGRRPASKVARAMAGGRG